MTYRNTLHNGFDIYTQPRYLFKFTIPVCTFNELAGVVAYKRVTDRILHYLERRINVSQFDLIPNVEEQYIGIIIENSIYDMFTELEDIDYDSNYTSSFGIDYSDLDEYVLQNGDIFRRELYIFSRLVINTCINEINKVDKSMMTAGMPIETYVLTRSKEDPTTLNVSCYLGKIPQRG